MVDYSGEYVLPVPRDRVWWLLNCHTDDTLIHQIHPLVLAQRTVSRSATEVVAERTIQVRKKVLPSTWKLTMSPPDLYRWEILEGEGPWAKGNFLENRYSEAPGGTLVRTIANLSVLGVPGFLQRRIIRGVFDTIDMEDQAFLLRPPSGHLI
jgi:hypothetical protein